MDEKLSQELRIINAETSVYQLEYINPDHYNKKELEHLYLAITNKIQSNDNEGLNYYNNKARKRFQNKIWQRQIQIDAKENFKINLEFETHNSYLTFRILSEYFENKTKLATTMLTWENIEKHEEINSLRVIFIPPFSKEIKNPLAYMISRMRILEYLNDYSLNATNEEELKRQFLEYNKRMEKYYENESEELDDYDDDNSFDYFGEPYYETD